MTSNRIWHFALLLALAASAGGCSRIFVRHRTVVSQAIVIDTRRDPSESLSGCFIPEELPAVAKVPAVFDEEIPSRARFTDATCETLEQSGEPLAVLKPVIDGNTVYFTFAVAKPDATARVKVRIKATYQSR